MALGAAFSSSALAARANVTPSSRSSRVQLAQPGRMVSATRRAALQVQAKKTADGPKIAIAGESGAVGQEFLKVECLLSCIHLRLLSKATTNEQS